MTVIPYQLVMIIVAKCASGGVDVKCERFNFNAPIECDKAKHELEQMDLTTPQVTVSFAIVRDVMVEVA